MATYAALKARIADDLARSDLTTQIAEACEDAVRLWQTHRFHWNEIAFTFSTVIGQGQYSSSDSSYIPDLYAIDAVYWEDGSDSDPLVRITEREAVALQTVSLQGDPSWYSYFERKLRLYPKPSTVNTIRVLGHIKLALPADGAENAWTTEAFDLIRSQAKLFLAMNVTKDDVEAKRMAEMVNLHHRSLKGTTNRMVGLGQVQGYSL
jgi:hypothetical protein